MCVAAIFSICNKINNMENDSKQEIPNCEVCDSKPFKYRCPRCEVQTCSLDCVKIHKKELACTGERDSTAFVRLSKFTNLNLLSDYRFLEDIDRTVNNCRRNPMKRYTRYHQQLPVHLNRLKSAAAKRRIHLQYLPQHFTRHKENKSILDYKTQEITWKLDFIFPQGETIKICEVVSEKAKLCSVLDKYLDPVQCPDKYKQYLRFYHSSGASDVLVLLKAERTKDPKAVYLLDLFSDIDTNLKNRIIIENPIMLVVKKAYKDEYTILDDDSEVTSEPIYGKKAGFFGDFSPVGYFDSLEPKVKKPSRAEEAMKSVRASARALRQDQRDESEDEDEDDVEEPQEVSYRGPTIMIPSYEQLCNP